MVDEGGEEGVGEEREEVGGWISVGWRELRSLGGRISCLAEQQ